MHICGIKTFLHIQLLTPSYHVTIIIITYFDVLNEEDLQRLMSMMMYMIVMKNVGMAKDVMKKLIWKASKL